PRPRRRRRLTRRQSWLGRRERIAEPFELTVADCDDLERTLEALELRMLRQPGLSGTAEAPLLLRADHLERVAEALADLLLDLAEDQVPAPAGDDVELVPAGPGVPPQDPVAADPVVPGGAPLGLRASLHASAPAVRASASSSER